AGLLRGVVPRGLRRLDPPHGPGGADRARRDGRRARRAALLRVAALRAPDHDDRVRPRAQAARSGPEVARLTRARRQGGRRTETRSSVVQLDNGEGSVVRRAPGSDPTVLYVGGWGRSGSTLLECVLAEAEQTVALGEVVWLWERGLGRNELCACGQPFHDCP